jgi:DNA-directed RNA polymerase subunit N (RpoN/RPB10)
MIPLKEKYRDLKKKVESKEIEVHVIEDLGMR